MKALARIALLMVCCGLAIPAIADAKVKPSPTQVTFTGGNAGSIVGTVSSRYVHCVRGRTVQLVDLSTGVAFHTLTTDRRGGFSIALGDIPADSAGFRVRAQPVRIHNWQCQAGSAAVEGDFVTLSGGPHDGAFTGVLFSSVPACEPGRVISLYDVGSGEPIFTGFDFADANGAWRIAQNPGTWQAGADPIFARTGGTVTLCQAVTSSPWTFEEPQEEQ
jgi:hypothetical protein